MSGFSGPPVGTSGPTVGLLNGDLTFSGSNIMTGILSFTHQFTQNAALHANALLTLAQASVNYGFLGAADNVITGASATDFGIYAVNGINLGASGNATRMRITATGTLLGAATGGLKGIDTLNAVAVYDDNVLLTAYPFEALAGEIDVAKWDARVPDREHPEQVERQPVLIDSDEDAIELAPIDGGFVLRATGKKKRMQMALFAPVFDDDGNGIDAVLEPQFDEVQIAPARIERRQHDPLRKFMAKVGTEYDPTKLESYIKHWQDKQHLTSLPNEANFDPLKGLSVGEWMQRLIETVELQAVHDKQLLDTITAQAARIDALEKRLAKIEGK